MRGRTLPAVGRITGPDSAEETGSDVCADILVSSQLVYPEARAALAAAARGGRIGESTHVSAVATLEDLYAQLRTVGIDEALARHAASYAPRTGSGCRHPSAIERLARQVGSPSWRSRTAALNRVIVAQRTSP
jgi:hypothetical protein